MIRLQFTVILFFVRTQSKRRIEERQRVIKSQNNCMGGKISFSSRQPVFQYIVIAVSVNVVLIRMDD